MKGLRPGFNPKASVEFTATILLFSYNKELYFSWGNVAVYLHSKKEN